MTPSWRLPGAVAGATAAPGRRGSSTIGRAGLVSRAAAAASTSARSAAAARSAAITANGLSSRCLRCAERGDGLLAGGVGGQVVAAQALDGEDPAVAEEFGGRVERVSCASPVV